MSPHYLGFIWYRSLAQLRSESSRAYLGYLWWLLEPLLYLMVFYVVFALVLNRGGEDYVQVLLTGLVVWKWFDGSVRASMDVINQNAGLIDKVYLPKIVFPSVCVLANGIKFILVLSFLLLFSVIMGNGITSTWLFLPVLLVVQLLFVYAASCLVAAITPFLPDIKMVFDKLMTLLFFLSGIFFTLDSVDESIRTYFSLNPAFALIESYRAILVHHQLPELNNIIYISGISVLALLIAIFVLRRYDRVYPRLIY